MFFARGMTAVIIIDTIDITDKTYEFIANCRIPVLGHAFISISVVIAVIVLLIAAYIARYTKFGRAAYAIGGNEQSAMLMGLPIGRTKIGIYMLGGVCSTLSGIVFSFYMRSGFTLHGLGMEMEAIASAVIGGTLLTGGVGSVFGTLFGVLIQGTIQSLIMFQGTLSSWWTKIAVAILLCMFIVIQSLLTYRRVRKKSALVPRKVYHF
jgi:simple sugar transport system permease protein